MVAGCAVTPETRETIAPSLVLVDPSEAPFFTDDLDGEKLERATIRSLTYYERLPLDALFSVGKDVYSIRELKESLLKFLEIMATSESDKERDSRIKKIFNIYKSVGRGEGGSVLFTGYYAPILHGSLKKTERYRYPLYRVPDDHVVIDLGQFKDAYAGESIVARIENGNVVPYYTREEIDRQQRLEGRGLEIAWVDDPVDLFFLHIQGSGTIRLPDGTFIKVGYAHKNGHRYRSIGTFLVNRGDLLLDGSSLEDIKGYLRAHPRELFDVLAHNESYIFFRITENGPVGCLNVPVTPRRSIATDVSLFPKGALAFIRTKKPVINRDGSIEKWIPFSRFVLNQDTGGVITGPGRVDLFCGQGRDAEIMAGHLKEYGELYFLIKKK
jgi:membrane-bound lytic murein transglycosylase A